MALKKNQLAIALLALFSMTVLAACASAASPTATPAPTATPTPVPVNAIEIDPQVDPDGFLAALPSSEVDCASSSVGGEDTLKKLITFADDATEGVTDTQLKVLAACVSDETVKKIVVGQLELETGGLSDATAACVGSHADGIDFATLFSGQAVEQETIVSTMQALFCLNDEERRALESSDQEIIGIADVGGIDALECAVDGAGSAGLQEFGAIFGTDGTVDVLAVSEFMPLLIDCGVIDDDLLADTGISADQYSCLFSHLDAELLNSILANANDPNAAPDLSSAASLLGAFGECGIDLQDLVEAGGSAEIEPPTGIGGGADATPELLVCLTDNGVDPSTVAEYAVGLADGSDATLLAALDACQNGGSSSGSGGSVVIPDTGNGETTIDPSVFEALPISAEQAQCLIDEVGIDQLEGIADGTVSPLTVLGALGACNISITDLIAG